MGLCTSHDQEDASRGIDWGSRKPKKASSKGNRTPRVHTPTSPGGRRQEGKPSRPSDVRDNLKVRDEMDAQRPQSDEMAQERVENPAISHQKNAQQPQEKINSQQGVEKPTISHQTDAQQPEAKINVNTQGGVGVDLKNSPQLSPQSQKAKITIRFLSEDFCDTTDGEIKVDTDKVKRIAQGIVLDAKRHARRNSEKAIAEMMKSQGSSPRAAKKIKIDLRKDSGVATSPECIRSDMVVEDKIEQKTPAESEQSSRKIDEARKDIQPKTTKCQPSRKIDISNNACNQSKARPCGPDRGTLDKQNQENEECSENLPKINEEADQFVIVRKSPEEKDTEVVMLCRESDTCQGVMESDAAQDDSSENLIAAAQREAAEKTARLKAKQRQEQEAKRHEMEEKRIKALESLKPSRLRALRLLEENREKRVAEAKERRARAVKAARAAVEFRRGVALSRSEADRKRKAGEAREKGKKERERRVSQIEEMLRRKREIREMREKRLSSDQS
ncbi:hypothetical protein AAMO2058_000122500 [Amorphochlora amoebiformis]